MLCRIQGMDENLAAEQIEEGTEVRFAGFIDLSQPQLVAHPGRPCTAARSGS
jgi:hypothetical protein